MHNNHNNRSRSTRLLGVLALTLGVLVMSGCATTNGDPRDPIEPFNRAVFEFNDTVDRAVLKPAAQGYKAVLPQPVRTGITNFFSNLRDPWISLNQLLQGKLEEGVSDFMRFVINTTFGLGGIFDVASEGGLPKHDEDFGQTLGVWGFEPGPYVVLPLFGPSSVRDGAGRGVDSFGYVPWRGPGWVDAGDEVAIRNSLVATDTVNIRANLLDMSNVLEGAALDRYTFVRDAYFQRRRNLVYDGNPPPQRYDDYEDFEDYDDYSDLYDGMQTAPSPMPHSDPAAPTPHDAAAPAP